MESFRNEVQQLLAMGPPNLRQRSFAPRVYNQPKNTGVTSTLRNLISNPSGGHGYSGWTITKEGGKGWTIEDVPANCSPVPQGKFLGLKPQSKETCCFATSYEWCAKSYLVHLANELSNFNGNSGFTSIEIKCGQMYMARKDCGGEFTWRLRLLDADKSALKEYEAEYELSCRETTSPWKRAEYTFKFEPKDEQLVEKIQYMEFIHEGKDEKWWAGHYGIKFARSTVVVVDLTSQQNEKLKMHGYGKDKNENTKFSSNAGTKKGDSSNADLSCLNCPVCLGVPRNKNVFQCKNGHMICEECIDQLSTCPQCRIPMRKEDAVRNRALEAVLEAMKI